MELHGVLFPDPAWAEINFSAVKRSNRRSASVITLKRASNPPFGGSAIGYYRGVVISPAFWHALVQSSVLFCLLILANVIIVLLGVVNIQVDLAWMFIRWRKLAGIDLGGRV